MRSTILGISAFYHDSAAALIIDGKIIAAAHEERFTRIKHDPNFPKQAIKAVLKSAEISLDDVDHIVFYEKPLEKFRRIIATAITFSPFGFKNYFASMKTQLLGKKVFVKNELISGLSSISKDFDESRLLFSEHHLSHAASAFYPSPFEEALVLCVDGVGEFETTSLWHGQGKQLTRVKSINFPHSLGLFYSAITYFCGFKVNSGEYKLMGLAPYGKPRFVDALRKTINVKDDGSYSLDLDYFEFCSGTKMAGKKLEKLLGFEICKRDGELSQNHIDLASSAQQILEEIILKICNDTQNKHSIKNLCLAGGVALNCVSNGKILSENLFENVWVQPASGDAGGALGAAYVGHFFLGGERQKIHQSNDHMNGAYLGPEYDNCAIQKCLAENGIMYRHLTSKTIIQEATKLLEAGAALGWFQGRSEFGPRALGNRSIIADPRNKNTQKDLNIKTKFRESFRPFAPAVLQTEAKKWFEGLEHSPYMMFVDKIAKNKRIDVKADPSSKDIFEIVQQKRSDVPAITHVDYSARVQTVDGKFNPLFHELIKAFYKKTGCPMLVNTSFNVRGEPIVETPEDALRCFLGTNLDALFIGEYLVLKSENLSKADANFKTNFEPD